jgi:osmotically-inducible protein OsmY
MHPINTLSSGLENKAWFVIVILVVVFVAGIGTAGVATEVTDITISDAIEDRLLQDDSIRAHLIDVATTDGIVNLGGAVDNLLAKERAGRIAQSLKGVREVVNTIRVIPPILRSDTEIAKDVKAALKEDPAADVYEIDVLVKDHVVTLSGTVES